MANGNPVPGWYQDPRDAAQVRWWDGGGWTQNTQPMPGVAPVVPEPAQPTFEQPVEPTFEQPVQPTFEQPVQPTFEQPVQPTFEQPVQPTFEQPADPWAAASQQAADQQWGQAPAQPGADQQWGQAPAQQAPDQQWGQAPAQQPPDQQWGQAPAQQAPDQQWGQAPAQQGPDQQWGQAPAQQAPDQQWGQAPAQQAPDQQWGQAPAQQPQDQQWGQAPAQPGADQWGQGPAAEGGWQQQQAGAWGSAVPPAPVPGGLAPGSPMGQTNVFPTAESVDPITGMPVTQADTKSKTSGKRLAALVGATLLVGLLILGLLWFFLFRSPSNSGSGTSTGPVEVTATFTGTIDPACADLGAALTADGLSTTVAQRLNDVAIAKDLEENQAYFEQLAKDIKPIMDQYQSTCVAAVSAGDAPEFYRTFVETFQVSVTDGEAVATSALGNGGQVPAADAERLRAEASKLQASGDAVVTVSGGSPSPAATVPTPTASESVPPSPAATDSVVPSPIG